MQTLAQMRERVERENLYSYPSETPEMVKLNEPNSSLTQHQHTAHTAREQHLIVGAERERERENFKLQFHSQNVCAHPNTGRCSAHQRDTVALRLYTSIKLYKDQKEERGTNRKNLDEERGDFGSMKRDLDHQ